MITTSYFASKAPSVRKICIALKRPRYFHKGGLHVIELAPSNPWAENWQDLYWQDLQQRFPHGRGLAELLERIEARVKDPILCCYEKDPATCHRHLLSAYIKKHIGIDIPEWSVMDEQRRPPTTCR